MDAVLDQAQKIQELKTITHLLAPHLLLTTQYEFVGQPRSFRDTVRQFSLGTARSRVKVRHLVNAHRARPSPLPFHCGAYLPALEYLQLDLPFYNFRKCCRRERAKIVAGNRNSTSHENHDFLSADLRSIAAVSVHAVQVDHLKKLPLKSTTRPQPLHREDSRAGK